MLRIRVIKAVAPRVRYFLRGSALSAAEKTGQWHGAGVAVAGLDSSRPVSEADFSQALKGYAPDGRYLGQQRKENRRAGWDVVISPHKSISVAALCLSEAFSSQILEAYDAAIRAALLAMESLACRCDGRRSPVATGNLIVAAFRHERSRRNDPHLHTHCIVINATFDHGHGARWRGLEASPFFRHNLLLDAVFQRELHRQLTLRGFPVSLDEKGRAMLPVPAAITARLSTAKQAIEQAVAQAVRNRPPHLQEFRDLDSIRNRINDRIRPPKTPPRTTLAGSLTSAERRSISRTLRPTRRPSREPEPPADALAQRIEAHYLPRTLWPSSKALFRAVVLAARDTIAAPFDSFLRALPWVRHPNPLRAPKPLPSAVAGTAVGTSLLATPQRASARRAHRSALLHRPKLSPTFAAAAARLRAARKSAAERALGNLRPLPSSGATPTAARQ